MNRKDGEVPVKAHIRENRMDIDIPKMAPCPKCREHENLGTELHLGTIYAKCGECGHRGPELLPRGDDRQLRAEAVRAWNNLPR